MQSSALRYISLALLAVIATAHPYTIHVADVRFNVDQPVPAGLTPQGVFIYYPILSGTFNTTSTSTQFNSPKNTSPLLGRVLPGGSDHAQIHSDGSVGLTVTTGVQGVDSPHEFFHFTAYGYVQPGLDLVGNKTTRFGDLDAYQVIRISTNSTVYGWLNSALLVAQERLVIVEGAVKHVDLKVFRVIIQTINAESSASSIDSDYEGSDGDGGYQNDLQIPLAMELKR